MASVTLREIVAARTFVGRQVRVTGRCLPPLGTHPLGAFRHGVDEWQLESDGVAIPIVGARPGVCAAGSAAATITVTALVAEDTLPPIGDLPAAPRRYLVLVVAGAE